MSPASIPFFFSSPGTRKTTGIPAAATMGSAEKLCLSWNDFEANISTSFRDLRQSKALFDVSLLCQDDHVLEAHKVILAACSPFFRRALARQARASPLGILHPVIYLRGISSANMRHVLDFMYHGEVNVEQDDLESFLAVAQDLQIKGLTQSDDSGGGAGGGGIRPKTEPGLKRPAGGGGDPLGPHPAKKRQQHLPGNGGGASATAPLPSTSKAAADDDDIEDVTPVKSEPAAGGSQMLEEGSFAAEAGAADAGEEEYDDGAFYEGGDMGAYGEDDGAMAQGAGGDGSKGRDCLVFILVLFSFVFRVCCWVCFPGNLVNLGRVALRNILILWLKCDGWTQRLECLQTNTGYQSRCLRRRGERLHPAERGRDCQRGHLPPLRHSHQAKVQRQEALCHQAQRGQPVQLPLPSLPAGVQEQALVLQPRVHGPQGDEGADL